jgi:sugar fermentation stimulation protein A
MTISKVSAAVGSRGKNLPLTRILDDSAAAPVEPLDVRGVGNRMTYAEIAGPLVPARFLQRYNRFLLQVRLDVTGETADAHMADPGRLKELLVVGKRVWLQPAGGPRRATRWTAVLVESPDGKGLVSLDTTLPNRLVGRALKSGSIEELEDWKLVRPEIRVEGSRLDFLLEGVGGLQMALEVKSVTLVEDGVGLFPDAVTERGARHVRELSKLARRPGWEAAILFVLQRSDASRIRAARRIDPGFSDALEEARDAGVWILGRRCTIRMDKVELGESVSVDVL